MNSTQESISRVSTAPTRVGLDLLGTVARWVLGFVFIYMGWTKAMDPPAFLKLIRQYELTNNSFLLNSLAAGLPWFEIFCGVLFVAGIGVRGSALLLLIMLVPFTGVVLKRAFAISDMQHIAFCAVRFDCGCGSGEVLICRKLVENGFLMLLAGVVLAGFGKKFAARFSLFGAGSPAQDAQSE